MKKRIVLTVLLAGFMCLGSGDMAFAGEFQTEEEGSAPEEELFTDGVPEQPEAFSAEGEENKEIFSSGSEDAEGTEGLEYEYIEETDSYRVVKGVDQRLVDIPAYYQGKPVTEIGAYAFAGYEDLESVTAFDSSVIGMIREGAFENCKNLMSFRVRYAVSIESNAFRGCNRLSWFTAENARGADIASDAFDPDTKVMFFGITPPKAGCYSVSAEDGGLFDVDGATILEDVVIHEDGLENANTIIDYNLSESRVDMNISEFYDWVDIVIGRKAFYGCDSIQELILPESTKWIDIKAFGECISLEKLYIPEGVFGIAEDAFMGCPNVTLYVTKGSYAEEYAKENNLPYVYDTIQIAPEIRKVTVNKNMVTVQFSKFTGDMYYCVLGTGKTDDGTPVRSGKNGRIAVSQTGNQVTFRNVNQGTYYIGARALSLDGDAKIYSEWSSLGKAEITVTTPERPSISSITQTGNRLRVVPSIPDGADGYIVTVGRGTTKNDSSTAAAAVPARKAGSRTVSGTGAVTLRNAKPGTYYIGIQTFIRNSDGSKTYSQWSPLKRFTVK